MTCKQCTHMTNNLIQLDHNIIQYGSTVAKQKQPEAVKKGRAKQTRIKRIIWHLRWLVSTRTDIGLWPSGSVRIKTDIKLRPSTLVRTGTDIKLQPIGLVRSYKD